MHKHAVQWLFKTTNGYSCVRGATRGQVLLINSMRTIYGDHSNSMEPISQSDIEVIINEIHTRKGTLKKSLNSYDTSPRAYYVWRLARFHGGKDITMPMTATLLCNARKEGEANMKALDQVADVVAKDAFGTNMHAAQRWGSVLGYAR
jgi:hypothetical protein